MSRDYTTCFQMLKRTAAEARPVASPLTVQYISCNHSSLMPCDHCEDVQVPEVSQCKVSNRRSLWMLNLSRRKSSNCKSSLGALVFMQLEGERYVDVRGASRLANDLVASLACQCLLRRRVMRGHRARSRQVARRGSSQPASRKLHQER